MKTCSMCGATKPSLAFSCDRHSKDGLQSRCKECKNVYYRQYHQENKEKHKEASRIWHENHREERRARALSIYGLTTKEYNALLEKQGGVCAICRKAETRIDIRTKKIKPLFVDHDHISGQVRGLLCNRCNMALGYLDEDIDRVFAAAFYLKFAGELAKEESR